MTKVTKKDIVVGDFTFDITVEGPDGDAGQAAMDLNDRAVKLARAFDEGKPPEECEGLPVAFDWEKIVEGDA